jgi:hypothetical protein
LGTVSTPTLKRIFLLIRPLARTVTTGLTLLICTWTLGYQYGRHKQPENKAETKSAETENLDGKLKATTEDGEDEEAEDIADGDLSSVTAGWVEPCKLVSRKHYLVFLGPNIRTHLLGPCCPYRHRYEFRENICPV